MSSSIALSVSSSFCACLKMRCSCRSASDEFDVLSCQVGNRDAKVIGELGDETHRRIVRSALFQLPDVSLGNFDGVGNFLE